MSPFCDIRCGLEREELVRVHLASIYCLFFLFFLGLWRAIMFSCVKNLSVKLILCCSSGLMSSFFRFWSVSVGGACDFLISFVIFLLLEKESDLL